MSKISTFLKNNDSSLVLLNKDLYYKILFVESDTTDSLLNTVDNNDDFITSFFEDRGCGYSFNAKPFFYRNNLTSEIFFSLNVLPFYGKYGVLLTNLNSLLFFLKKKEDKKFKKDIGLLFLKVIPGGYKCIYIGILGFLPKRQFCTLFLKLKLRLQYIDKYCAILFSKNFYSIFFRRICCAFTIKMKAYNFYHKQQRFVKKIKKFEKRKSLAFNVVFLYSNSFKYTNIKKKIRGKKKRYKKTVPKKYA
jgi:hypothetical protein